MKKKKRSRPHTRRCVSAPYFVPVVDEGALRRDGDALLVVRSRETVERHGVFRHLPILVVPNAVSHCNGYQRQYQARTHTPKCTRTGVAE
jgi:hypothetical protein